MEEPNDQKLTSLMEAAQEGNRETVAQLLNTHADTEATWFGQTALSLTEDRDIIQLLLNAGADTRNISHEGKRAIMGLPLDVSPDQFQEGRLRRFGTENPAKQNVPFWDAMIRSGISAYKAAKIFRDRVEPSEEPVWCAERFGQSVTLLPDGRVMLIGGEHEDSYDPGFCIYNDVIDGDGNGGFQLYGYPEEVFPPTDFHSATLMGSYVFIIGRLGYPQTRRYGETPVYRLHTDSLRIDKMEIGGEAPGWIFGHSAVTVSAHEIRIRGGKIATWHNEEETHSENSREFVFDTERLTWTSNSPNSVS